MTLQNLYDKYLIPEGLRTHMLSVAGLGKIICDTLLEDVNVDKNKLISALLVHDMGNIVKFDFSIKSIHKDPKEIKRLKKIQVDFIQKYGKDAHTATDNILKDAKIEESIIDITNKMIVENLEDIIDSKNWELMIATYSDYRIAPSGIVSLNDRVNDLVARLNKKPSSPWSDPEIVAKYRKNLLSCEAIIQNKCTKDLNQVTKNNILAQCHSFLQYELQVIKDNNVK